MFVTIASNRAQPTKTFLSEFLGYCIGSSSLREIFQCRTTVIAAIWHIVLYNLRQLFYKSKNFCFSCFDRYVRIWRAEAIALHSPSPTSPYVKKLIVLGIQFNFICKASKFSLIVRNLLLRNDIKDTRKVSNSAYVNESEHNFDLKVDLHLESFLSTNFIYSLVENSYVRILC